MTGLKINLGCGYDGKEGYVNVDRVKTPCVDVLADVMRLPFREGVFCEGYMSHVLEHLPDPDGGMRELCRIVEGGGAIIIRVPHAFTHSSFLNPTHRIHFLIGTVLYWTHFNEFGVPLFDLQNTELRTGREVWNKILNYRALFWERLVFPIWLLNPEIVYTLRKK